MTCQNLQPFSLNFQSIYTHIYLNIKYKAMNININIIIFHRDTDIIVFDKIISEC